MKCYTMEILSRWKSDFVGESSICMILLESFHVKGKNVRKHNISKSGGWAESCDFLPKAQAETNFCSLHIP